MREDSSIWCCGTAMSWYSNQTIITKEDHVLWCCETAASWYEKIQQPQQEQQLLTLSKACIDSQGPFPQLATVESNIMLYALGVFLMDYIRVPAVAFKLRDTISKQFGELMYALEKWKSNFEKEARRNLSPAMAQRHLTYYFLLVLHGTTNLDVLRFTAGDTRIVSPETRAQSEDDRKSLLTAWANSPNGKKAVVAAVEFISSALDSTRDLTIEPQIAWSLYIATLVCWGYEEYSTTKPSTANKGPWNPQINAMEYIGAMRAYGPLASAIPQGGTHSTSGLLVYTRSMIINDRWGLLRYGAGILGRLAEARGIYLQR